MSSIAELLASSGLTRPSPSDAAEAFVHPGQIFTTAAPARVTTVLGSCVAICMFDPIAALGGMNHYMFPVGFGRHSATPRYAVFAITKLIEELLDRGASRHRLQAKLFGGACVLTAFQNGGHDLGSKNAEAGRQCLAAERIPLTAEDAGGNHGRKVVFHTDTGLVTVRRVG